MGTRLHTLSINMRGKKLSDGLGVGGQHRLTDKMIDKMQNFYGQCVRNSDSDIISMKNSIWAIYTNI